MRKLVYAALAAMATFVVAAPANAATFTVDPAQSSISLIDLTAGGFPFGPQNLIAGDVKAFYTGTVDATVDTSGLFPVVTFGAGSYVDAILNPNAPGGEYLPTEGGFVPGASNDPNLAGGDFIFADGSLDPTGEGDGLWSVGEDNYGISGIGFVGGIKAAVRNFAVGFGGSGIANDGFADAHLLNVIDGWYAIDLAGAGIAFTAEETTEVAALQALGPNAAGNILYSKVGFLEEIRIPFNITFEAFGVLTTTAVGEIVATRTPEPTSGLFLASLLAGVGAVRRRRN